MMKRIFTTALALTLIFSSFSGTAVSANNDVVYLGSDIEASEKGAFITEYSPVNGSFTMAGVTYHNGISTNRGKSAFEGNNRIMYTIDGHYTVLSGVYGALDEMLGLIYDDSCTIAVLGDGKLIAQFAVSSGDMPKPFTVDVTGVQELTISFIDFSGFISCNYALANVVLTVGEPIQPPQLRSPLLEATAYLGQDIKAYRMMSVYEYPNDGSFKMGDVSYFRGISGRNSGSTAYYNIDGRYKVLSGLYGSLDYIYSGNSSIVIIGDGKVLAQFDVSAADNPKSFSVDVTGIQQLIISFSADAYALADAILSETSPSNANNHSSWAEEELKRADELNLIPDSLKDSSIDYTLPITRAEFAGVAIRAYASLANTTVLPTTNNPFTDTQDADVLKAYNAGIMVGISGIEFAPDTLLNREQAATALTRVFKRATIPEWTFATDANYPLRYNMPAVFDDDKFISSWARDSVYFMNSNGIILGVGSNMFAPRATTSVEEAAGYATATREQALIIALRMVENLR